MLSGPGLIIFDLTVVVSEKWTRRTDSRRTEEGAVTFLEHIGVRFVCVFMLWVLQLLEKTDADRRF